MKRIKSIFNVKFIKLNLHMSHNLTGTWIATQIISHLSVHPRHAPNLLRGLNHSNLLIGTWISMQASTFCVQLKVELRLSQLKLI